MIKFIVRESDGEFFKVIEAESMEAARLQFAAPYTIEVAPQAEMFENNDWQEDFNSTMSRFHY